MVNGGAIVVDNGSWCAKIVGYTVALIKTVVLHNGSGTRTIDGS